MLAAASSPAGGGVIDRFLAHLRGLVQVRVLNETQGDDPAALVSQIEADIRRGDVSGALAAFAKLPEPARQAASGWAAQAGAKEAADAALQVDTAKRRSENLRLAPSLERQALRQTNSGSRPPCRVREPALEKR